MARKKKEKKDPRLEGGLEPAQMLFIREKVQELMAVPGGKEKVERKYWRDDMVSQYALGVAREYEELEEKFLHNQQRVHNSVMGKLRDELATVQSIAGGR